MVLGINRLGGLGCFSRFGILPCISGLQGGLRCYIEPIVQWSALINIIAIIKNRPHTVDAG